MRYQKACVNDADPITLDPLGKDCFFIESDSGFVHGVEPKSLLRYILKTGKPENPITRATLNDDTLMRLCQEGNTSYAFLKSAVHDIQKAKLAEPSQEDVTMDEIGLHISMVQEQVDAIIDILGDCTIDHMMKQSSVAVHFQPLALSIAYLKTTYGDSTKDALSTVWGFLGDLRKRIQLRRGNHWLRICDVDYVVELIETFINYNYHYTPRTPGERSRTSVTPGGLEPQ